MKQEIRTASLHLSLHRLPVDCKRDTKERADGHHLHEVIKMSKMMLSSILQNSHKELQERKVKQSSLAKGEHFQFERQAGKVARSSNLAKQTTWVGIPALSPISCVPLSK